MRRYTDSEMAMGKMVLQFYNAQTGLALRCGAEDKADSNICLIMRAADKIGVAKLRERIRGYVRQAREDGEEFDLKELMYSIIYGSAPASTPTPTPAPAPAPAQSVPEGMGLLEKVVAELVSRISAENIENEIMGQVQNTVRNFISSEYGPINRNVVTAIDNKPVNVKGVQHEKFETVLKFVNNREPVYLVGPAGSGKNVLCKQVAEALGLQFYFTNAVTQEYKLTGFTDAMGNYQESQFYKAFKNGGLFMLDEMDASIPEVLVILNAAIANGYFDFPAPIGYVEAHPDFRVIAAGNTIGQGADYEYVGRNQLDAASLDRFAVIKVDYDKTVESTVAGGNESLVEFCREFRSSAKRAGQQVVISYRCIGRLAKMVQIMDAEEALSTCLVKGMEKDDLNMIISNMNSNSEYTTALKNLIRSM